MTLKLTPGVISVARNFIDVPVEQIIDNEEHWMGLYILHFPKPMKKPENWFPAFIGRYMLKLSEKDDISRIYGSPLFWLFIELDPEEIRKYITPEISLDCIVSFIKEYVEMLDLLANVISLDVGCSKTAQGYTCNMKGKRSLLYREFPGNTNNPPDMVREDEDHMYTSINHISHSQGIENIVEESDINIEDSEEFWETVDYHHQYIIDKESIEFEDIDLYAVLAGTVFTDIQKYRFSLTINSSQLLFLMYINSLDNGRVHKEHHIIQKVLSIFNVYELKFGADRLGSSENIRNIEKLMNMEDDFIVATYGEFHIPRLYFIINRQIKILRSREKDVIQEN